MGAGAVPDSLFGRMFDPEISLGMVPTDEDGNIFFDRDPEVFRWILDFLRRQVGEGLGAGLRHRPGVARYCRHLCCRETSFW